MADIDCASAMTTCLPWPASPIAASPAKDGVPTAAPETPPSAAPNGAPVGHTTFGEFLHAINPLQHLPVIGTIYRAVTGDTIQPAYRIAGAVVGGIISGGPLGVLGTVAGCLAEELYRLGWNMPDPSAPQSGTASADSGQRPALTADARTVAPDLPDGAGRVAGVQMANYQPIDVRGSG